MRCRTLGVRTARCSRLVGRRCARDDLKSDEDEVKGAKKARALLEEAPRHSGEGAFFVSFGGRRRMWLTTGISPSATLPSCASLRGNPEKVQGSFFFGSLVASVALYDFTRRLPRAALLLMLLLHQSRSFSLASSTLLALSLLNSGSSRRGRENVWNGPQGSSAGSRFPLEPYKLLRPSAEVAHWSSSTGRHHRAPNLSQIAVPVGV